MQVYLILWPVNNYQFKLFGDLISVWQMFICSSSPIGADAFSVVDPLSRTESSRRLGAPPALCFTAYVEERPGTPDQPLMDVQVNR